VAATASSRIPATRLAAWESLLRAHASLVRDLDAELQATHAMSLGDYDVLVTLANAPGGRMRMRELADRVILSRSGVTRRIDRLVSSGLVCRERALDDGRSIDAVLTDAGRARLREAAPTHLEGVDARFLARYSDDELATIVALLGRVPGDVGVACDVDAAADPPAARLSRRVVR
jgi:DNA-binding MarR family transcriptional regulator